MNVQSNLGLQAFQQASRIAPPVVPAVVSGTPALSGSVESVSDKVTISGTAMALASSEDVKALARSPGQEQFLQTLRTNTEADSEKLAYELAYSRSQITYDISHGDTRLSSTGQIVSDDFKESFEQLAAAVDVQKRALYETERANGTPPNEIIAKIIDFGNAQSQAYRIGTGVGFDTGLRF